MDPNQPQYNDFAQEATEGFFGNLEIPYNDNMAQSVPPGFTMPSISAHSFPHGFTSSNHGILIILNSFYLHRFFCNQSPKYIRGFCYKFPPLFINFHLYLSSFFSNQSPLYLVTFFSLYILFI